MAKLSVCCVCVLLVTATWWQDAVDADALEDVTGTWATKFGEELWQLGKSVTKLGDIKERYRHQNVKVKNRDGEELLSEITTNVGRMLHRKVNAVKCIVNAAEKLNEEFDESQRETNYTYYSAKYSSVNGEVGEPVHVIYKNEYYNPIWLQPHRAFNNVPVNTSHSAVHVPTNLHDRAPRVLDAIEWSEPLNEVFQENYISDPALSWQYFGHFTGFLRSFPAMHWNQEVDQFDQRFREAYIESATCSKEMIILLDTTGSMTGMRINIARLTVSDILDTLSNNDYVNVFNFSDVIQEVVPCYKDMLVQATPENRNAFKEAVKLIKPEGHANFSVVFTQAFQLLQEYRDLRSCGNGTTDAPRCNQVIMLITDGVPYNITEVFEEYNWLDNGTHIPVRIFTYLVGREVTKVREVQLIACLNKGYYTHVHSLNEVREQVFEYIPVLARPLVLQGTEHPVTWTNVFADITDDRVDEWLWDVMEHAEQKERLFKYFRNKKLFFSQRDSDRKYVQQLKKEVEELDGKIRYREYRLMVTVSIPAFDNRQRNDTNGTMEPELLGVAGTDIYLDHIISLTDPYKIGVNGYAFMINNNGYVVMHPDLRPVSRGALKDNFNSVDLLEVEQLDDDGEPRELPEEILELREAMVNQTKGKMEGLRVKFHFDDMHRVAVEDRIYFFEPIEGTPFTMGLVLPATYGKTHVSVNDEVSTAQMTNTPLSNYFYGYNWKLRPDWVYCKYHHEHMFNSSEQELRHFLDKMSASDWKWSEQYEPLENLDNMKYSFEGEADRDKFSDCTNSPFVDTEEYYCRKELVLLLISDAKVTSPTFENPRWEFKSKEEEDLLLSYNTTLRFISTQSGLTRWQYMLETDEKDYHRTEFGNLHKRAIDEAWYIAAVLQHEIEPHSFVFSLSFDRIGITDGEAMVTASHALFHRDGGQEAPASVVGLQFRQTALFERFMKISSNPNSPDSREQCASDEIDCFVLDSGGYILITENVNDTGRFFGEIDGAIMEAMVHENIYRKVTIYDYHGLCFEEILRRRNDATILFTPLKYLQWFVRWAFSQLFWGLAQTNLFQLWAPTASVPMQSFQDLEEEYYDSVEVEDSEEDADDVNGTSTSKMDDEYWETINHPCDQKIDLYILQQKVLKDQPRRNYPSESGGNCSRPFYPRQIPNTNLLLVVVDAMYSSCYRKMSADPVELHDNTTYYACGKLGLVNQTRRKLPGCFVHHPEEDEITECGDMASQTAVSVVGVFICSLALLLSNEMLH